MHNPLVSVVRLLLAFQIRFLQIKFIKYREYKNVTLFLQQKFHTKMKYKRNKIDLIKLNPNLNTFACIHTTLFIYAYLQQHPKSLQVCM